MSRPVPLFDSLGHPTLSGGWFGRAVSAGFGDYLEAMDCGGFTAGCAVGMAGIEGYHHEQFAAECSHHPALIPIAGVDPLSENTPSQISALSDMGFRGIKIHPRLTGVTNSLGKLRSVFKAAEAVRMPIFYCTYLHADVAAYPVFDPFYSLVKLLREAPGAKVVLVHGGDVQCLRYAELVRFNPNLLLDVSLTLMKYRESSVDMDLRFLFQQFDQRLCIGTDFPDYAPTDVRERFEELSCGVSENKARNVGYGNLCQFLGLNPLNFD